jgi:hypothetical protein
MLGRKILLFMTLIPMYLSILVLLALGAYDKFEPPPDGEPEPDASTAGGTRNNAIK